MGNAITNGCNCKCTQEQFKDENEIIKSNSNCKNSKNKKYKGKEIYSNIYRNNNGKDEKENDISNNKRQNEEMFYDLDEPIIENLNYDPYNINQKNNNYNLSNKSNDNSNNISKQNNNLNNNSKSTTNYNSIYNSNYNNTNPNYNPNNNNNQNYNSNFNNNDNNNIYDNTNFKNNNSNAHHNENYNSIINKDEYFNSLNHDNENNFSNYEKDDYYNINDNENYNNANHINNNNYNHNIINNRNEDKINSEIDNEIYIPNSLNNNNKPIKKSTLKLFNISLNKSSIQNNNKNSKKKIIIPNHNRSKSQINLNESYQLNHSIIINGIYKLNDIFINQINKHNNKINIIWKNIDITSIISKHKVNSINLDEIMFNGFINRLIISNLFKNNSMNIQKFCIITKQDFIIFQNKENFLLMKNPQRKISLNEIENCGRLDFSLLKIHYLYGFYYMYLNMKDEFNQEYNDDDDEVYKIVKKEQNGKFYILFSKEEKIVNQWVCVINFFMNMYKQ